VNLTDGAVLSSKCSDIFIDCERLDAVGIVSGQLLRRRAHAMKGEGIGSVTAPVRCRNYPGLRADRRPGRLAVQVSSTFGELPARTEGFWGFALSRPGMGGYLGCAGLV
jgi:hypothetical protein